MRAVRGGGTAIVVVSVLALSACGGSNPEQVRACWRHAMAAYAPTYTKKGYTGQSEDTTATELSIIVGVHSQGKRLEPYVIPGTLEEVSAWLRRADDRCGGRYPLKGGHS